MTRITGKTLIGWGFTPGPWFPDAISTAQGMSDNGCPEHDIKNALEASKPKEPEILPLKSYGLGANGFEILMDFGSGNTFGKDARDNINAVCETMAQVMRTPVAEKGVVLPDACPAGPVGTIPVGGVVRSKYLHPGWHSADICCSVMCSVFREGTDPRKLLNAVQTHTHFGGGGRDGDRFPFIETPEALDAIEAFEDNYFLHNLMKTGMEHMGTQGDGNHFASVGWLRSTGQVCLVTHHGSRKPGAELYKKGIKLAAKQTKKISPAVQKQNAWIVDENDTQEYWKALQIIRQWTKVNHETIHGLAASHVGSGVVLDRFWNEHNFVFQKYEKFYHAKGATPMFDHHPDSDERRLIPLSMGQPILVVKPALGNPGSSFGFAPHGAGRNYSRTEHRRRTENVLTPAEQVEREVGHLDIRFWTGKPDVTELPSAYKCPEKISREIFDHRLASIVDSIDPYGCIMAGEWQERPHGRR